MLGLKLLQQILAGSSLRLIHTFFVLAVGSLGGMGDSCFGWTRGDVAGIVDGSGAFRGKDHLSLMLGLSILRAGGFVGACALSVGAVALVANFQQDDSSAGAAGFVTWGW